jgi:trans-aconitate methyltransferase
MGPPSSDMQLDPTLRRAREVGYESPREDVQAHVPPGSRRILEIGCSVGTLGAALKRRQDCRVVGIEIVPDYAREAASRIDRVLTGDVLEVLADAEGDAPFDCLIAADVLEHMTDPWTALERACTLLAPGATVVVSMPNVLYYRGLRRILRERRWPADDEGVFDRTHLRWFAPADMRALLEHAGLEVRRVDPQYWVSGRRLRLLQALDRTPLSPFLAPQYVVSAKTPKD